MKKEIIKRIIRDFHSRELPAIKERDTELPVDTGKIISVTGVRRSGKTYIIFDTIRRLMARGITRERIIYINFEDERLDLKKEELDLILQGYQELYPDTPLSGCYFFFDEVQNIDGWEKFTRRINDTITGNIFITGSNSRFLSKEIATSLRGRTITYEIFPLSFSEYLNFKDVEPDLYHSQTRAKIMNLFERYLLEGGFPEIAKLEGKSLKERILQEYFDVMFYRDLVESYGIINTQVLKYFIKRVLENVTSPLSVNKIYHELKSQGYKIGKNSLYDYLYAAESAYLFLILRKYTESLLKQELGEKKLYAIDNGLLNAVTFKFSKNYGKLLENAVLLEIHKKGEKVFFYKGRKECDFIVLHRSGIRSVIQASYSVADKSTRRREMEGLIEACKRTGTGEGHIVTFSEEEDLSEKGISIRIVPAYKFFLAGLS